MNTQKRVSDLHFGDVQSGFCPVCLNDCYCIKLREGGRQFGLKHVGDRDLSIFGELVWDAARAVYWHMSIEPSWDMTESEILSHFTDDMVYMLANGGAA